MAGGGGFFYDGVNLGPRSALRGKTMPVGRSEVFRCLVILLIDPNVPRKANFRLRIN